MERIVKKLKTEKDEVEAKYERLLSAERNYSLQMSIRLQSRVDFLEKAL